MHVIFRSLFEIFGYAAKQAWKQLQCNKAKLSEPASMGFTIQWFRPELAYYVYTLMKIEVAISTLLHSHWQVVFKSFVTRFCMNSDDKQAIRILYKPYKRRQNYVLTTRPGQNGTACLTSNKPVFNFDADPDHHLDTGIFRPNFYHCGIRGCTTPVYCRFSCMGQSAGRLPRKTHAGSVPSINGFSVCFLASSGTTSSPMMKFDVRLTNLYLWKLSRHSI